MRALVLLSSVLLAGANNEIVKQGNCLLDGAASASDLMDGAIFVFAAMERCGKNGEDVKCFIDITSAIEAIEKMVHVILKAVQRCGDLDTINQGCGFASSKLTKSVAAAAASGAQVYQKCPNINVPGKTHMHFRSRAMCVVDIKASLKSLLKAIKAIMKVKKDEGKGKGEAKNALSIVSAFAGLGGYFAGVMGYCTKEMNEEETLCGQATALFVHDLTDVAHASVVMSTQCEKANGGEGPSPVIKVVHEPSGKTNYVPANRLYDEGEAHGKTQNAGSAILAALLPITAVVSFVGGRFYANRRVRIEASRDVMENELMENEGM